MPDSKISFPKARSLEMLEADALFVLGELGRGDATVSISFATMEEMRQLKLEHLGKEQGVVDVLAFPEAEGFPHPDDPRRIGEVLLNWDAFGGDFAHLRFLLIHGILHLLGYQHEAPRDIIAMESLEEDLCRRTASRELTSDRPR